MDTGGLEDPLSPLLPQTPPRSSARLAAFTTRGYALVLILLVLFNVADNVLVVVLFDEFPEELAQYVNQGTAFVYILWSTGILLVQRACNRRRRLGAGKFEGPLWWFFNNE